MISEEDGRMLISKCLPILIYDEPLEQIPSKYQSGYLYIKNQYRKCIPT